MIHGLDANIIESGIYKNEQVVPKCSVSRKLSDGDQINCGEITIKTVHTPGQSPGSVVFLTSVEGPDGPCRVLFAGDSTGFKCSPKDFEYYAYKGVCRDFRNTVEILRSLEFDLYLGGHPHQVKREMRDDGSPFVTKDEWLKLVNGRHEQMQEFLKRFPKYNW
jgi:glyoxylase-like metal-dependent hydrolase (beta-lactamase superfamily II)